MARTRISSTTEEIPFRRMPAAALRAVWREGYGAAEFRRDALAGVIVGIVALPLAMALAIGVGVAPQYGLYTAIVAGFFVALLGGSRTQVSGPTAAFIVILAPLYTRFGMSGLLLCGLMGGLILIGMGLLRLGRLIEFIPYPVTTGFTAGIATVIGVMQLKDLFGLKVEKMPEHFFDRVGALAEAIPSFNPWELAVGLLTLAILVAPLLLGRRLPRALGRIPPPLVALPLAAVAAVLIAKFVPGARLETIASHFNTLIGGNIVTGIPQLPPMPLLPWNAPGPEGIPVPLDFHLVRELLPGALAVAMLGAIESLLSAVVADGMARTRHDPDAELLALGAGNLLCPFFGGIPATGAIARTATNIRSGGRSPVAAMVHALTVLLAVLALAPLIGFLPMTSLAALLLLVAWNMSEARHFVLMLRTAPKSDVAVLLTCFSLTVAFDMVVAVSVGIVLAALLFMRRMAEVTHTRLMVGAHPDLKVPLPDGVLLYDINGPLFFGAAQRAMSALRALDDEARAIILDLWAVILDLEEVSSIDATGMVALLGVTDELRESGCEVVLVGLQEQPRRAVEKLLRQEKGKLEICATLEEAVARLNVERAARSRIRSESLGVRGRGRGPERRGQGAQG